MTDTYELTDRKQTLIFINIIISCVATSMLATALSTALPQMASDLNISISTGQWITSGYSLAMGIIMPLTAFLITRFPTKKLYLTAIICFTLGLAICAVSPSFELMMVGRVLQACGNGLLMSMAQVIILTIYPSEKTGTVMGWYGLAVGVAPVMAPTIAGFLIDTVGWRMIFYISIFIMLISFVFALKVFADVLETTEKKFDFASFAISIFAFGGITLGIGNIGSFKFVSPQILLPLIVGVITSVLFAYRQLHLNQPFLDIRILKNKNYSLSVIGSMLLYFVMMGSSVIIPVYVQTIMGYSAITSALVSLPGSIAMAIISPFAGKIYDKFGMKKLFIAGSAFMLISNIGMVFITMNTSIWVASAYNVVRCVSIGCLMMPLVTWGVSDISGSLTADGTALLTSFRTIAGAIGSAIFVGIMTVVGNNSISKYGESAQIHGLNITFLAMSIFTLLLLFIAVFLVKDKKYKKI